MLAVVYGEPMAAHGVDGAAKAGAHLQQGDAQTCVSAAQRSADTREPATDDGDPARLLRAQSTLSAGWRSGTLRGRKTLLSATQAFHFFGSDMRLASALSGWSWMRHSSRL